MNKIIIILLAILAMPACTIKVYEMPPESAVYYQQAQPTVVYQSAAPVYYRSRPIVAYGWRARGCTNLNPNVCRGRGCR